MTSSIENRIFTDDEVFQQLHHDYCETSNYTSDQFSNLLNWLYQPPNYTTIRFNQCLKDSLRDELKNILNKQFPNFEPVIDTHPFLSDLLVIPSKNNLNIFPIPNGKEVIVDLKCGVSVLRGAPIFAPGVFGAPTHLQVGDKVSVYADLEGKCLKGFTLVFQGKKVFLGNGIVHLSRQDLFNVAKPSGIAVELFDRISNCPSLGGQLGPNMYLQNLPSVVCCHVLNPASNHLILDMCASPGGKTTHIASIINDNGVVVALDKTKNKLVRLQNTIAAQGFKCVKCFNFDSTKLFNENADSTLHPPFPANYFDKVLLDAPCSALGQRPQLFNKISAKELKSYPIIQRKLMTAAVQLVKPGGTIVYSTCTLVMSENEEIVEWALKNFADLTLESQIPHLGGFGLKGSKLSEEDRVKLQRFDVFSPTTGPDKDTIGFFIAKFTKKINVF